MSQRELHNLGLRPEDSPLNSHPTLKNHLGRCEHELVMEFFEFNITMYERLLTISDAVNKVINQPSPLTTSTLMSLVTQTQSFAVDSLQNHYHQYQEHLQLHDHHQEVSTQTENATTNISTMTLDVNHCETTTQTENSIECEDRCQPVLENSQAKPCQISDISISKLLCPCCSEQSHRLEDCVRFQSLKRHERSTVLRNHRICFDCLDGFHRTQICPDPGICSICNQKGHHTLLHREPKVHCFSFNSAQERHRKSTTSIDARSMDLRQTFLQRLQEQRWRKRPQQLKHGTAIQNVIRFLGVQSQTMQPTMMRWIDPRCFQSSEHH